MKRIINPDNNMWRSTDPPQRGTANMFYGYCNDQKPHTVRRIFDEKNEKHFDLRWDDAGNLGQISIGNEDAGFETGRFLFWTEDCYGCEHLLCQSNVVSNRMHAAVDEKHSSYYVYDHSGERRVKLTGTNDLLDVNADYMYTASVLREPTIYPSAYMVMSNRGYTKHYYAGAERVAARIGGGGLKVIEQEHRLSDKSGSVFKQSLEQINDRHLENNEIDCIANGLSSNDKLTIDMNEVPERMKAKLLTDYSEFRHMIADAQSIHHNEPDVYFYHSDHLGSASWITDNGGLAVQHLQYLPYGERYVDQRISGYSERFTFTGKERDEETGYGYFGARYMDHELMTMWLSVDPMSDKYPSLSPYAYCAWNPMKLVDPDGKDWYKTEDGKMHYTVKYTSKEKFQNSGIKGEYLGKTTTVGSKYYSLFGQELDKNSKNGQITMKIDDAMMKYKEYGIAYDIYLKSSSCWDPEPSHSYTDLTIPSVQYTHGSKNIHGPNEMGTYAGMADIYYYVNGSEKFMQGRLESWSPTTCVSGRNGNGTSPSRRGTDGKLIRSYITLRNENSINGVILGLNFHSEQMLANFKKKLDALYK